MSLNLYRYTFISFVFCALAVILNSCGGDDRDRTIDDLYGQWDVKHTIREVRLDTVYNEYRRDYTLFFDQEGNGYEYPNLLGDTVYFQWVFQEDPQKIVLIREATGIVLGDTKVYDITEYSSERQVWVTVLPGLSTVSDEFLHTLQLER